MESKVAWDEDKRAGNIEKHGIDFRLAGQVFDGRFAIERLDNRWDYGETRVNRLTELEGYTVHVTYTKRQDVFRLISVRRANIRERIAYEQAKDNQRHRS